MLLVEWRFLHNVHASDKLLMLEIKSVNSSKNDGKLIFDMTTDYGTFNIHVPGADT